MCYLLAFIVLVICFALIYILPLDDRKICPEGWWFLYINDKMVEKINKFILKKIDKLMI